MNQMQAKKDLKWNNINTMKPNGTHSKGYKLNIGSGMNYSSE